MGKWTNNEIELLVQNYPITTKDEICELIPDKTYLAIYKKAKKLRVCRTAIARNENAKAGRKKIPYERKPQTNQQGYVLVYAPSHPRANKSGMVLEHITVWETANNMFVPNGYVIHHINENKQDNRIENLLLMTQGEHSVYHNSHRQLSVETKQKISLKAKERLAAKENHPRYKNINICELKKAVENGATIKSVCQKYGIDRKTYYKKLERGY